MRSVITYLIEEYKFYSSPNHRNAAFAFKKDAKLNAEKLFKMLRSFGCLRFGFNVEVFFSRPWVGNVCNEEELDTLCSLLHHFNVDNQ